ncbi:MAG TPA: hypothetical protein VFH54_10485 [Mycobacteriales bacterium]|nr:hypothetical protein [Mycobacteriales bacterium]
MTAVAEPMQRQITSRGALAALGVAVGGVIILFGNADVKKGDNGGLGPAIGTAAIVVVLAAVLFAVVLPRVQNARRTAMIIGIVGVVSIVAFWSGVTPVLAAAAIAAVPPGEPRDRGVAIVQVLALVATALALIVTIAQSSLV